MDKRLLYSQLEEIHRYDFEVESDWVEVELRWPLVLKITLLQSSLFLVLVVLQLTHLIHCSWWWITLPYWLVPAVLLLTLLVLVITWLLGRFLNQFSA
ncbi:hypothetical protein G8759_31190 [Spirosoma aureum]|uniref:Uncharacterized protein n=1 Tax=Spirosoma aureum TaxID=2692134 RepID=A0A6G9AWS7_9BACT|nr:hypothetical protein [Spirosoma aureum]QIP16789.1 hypothetical protein G8759_31190 [Spirosoma aureum]